jgi:hypothetical protein
MVWDKNRDYDLECEQRDRKIGIVTILEAVVVVGVAAEDISGSHGYRQSTDEWRR